MAGGSSLHGSQEEEKQRRGNGKRESRWKERVRGGRERREVEGRRGEGREENRKGSSSPPA